MSIRNHLTPIDGGDASHLRPVLTKAHLSRSADRNEIRWPTTDEVNRRARQLKAQAFGELLALLGRGIATGVRRLASIAASFLAVVEEAAAARRAYEELSRLSDHELADIGLSRGDIAAVALRHPRRAETAVMPSGLASGELVSGELVEQEIRKAA